MLFLVAFVFVFRGTLLLPFYKIAFAFTTNMSSKPLSSRPFLFLLLLLRCLVPPYLLTYFLCVVHLISAFLVNEILRIWS